MIIVLVYRVILYTARESGWLRRCPVTAEIMGSNPIRVAINMGDGVGTQGDLISLSAPD